jgi:hypothetical protein
MSAGLENVFDEAYDGAGPRDGEARIVLASDWSSPILTPPTLTPSFPPIQTPPQAANPEPIAAMPPPAAARPAFPLSGAETSCEDLRRKAARLRSAASKCDEDVAAGAPYCNVSVRFDRPSIPKTIPPSSARGYAEDFQRYADAADERACAAYGGQRSPSPGIPTAGKCIWSGTTGNLALIIGVQASVEKGLCKDASGELTHKSRQCLCTGVGIGGGVSNGVQVGGTLRSQTSWSFSYGPCGVTNWGASCGFGFDVGAFRMECACNVESRN